MKFDVSVTETLCRIVEVEAETWEEAWDKINDDYFHQRIVLNAQDFVDVEIEVL